MGWHHSLPFLVIFAWIALKPWQPSRGVGGIGKFGMQPLPKLSGSRLAQTLFSSDSGCPETQWGKQSTKMHLLKPLGDFYHGSMTPASLPGCRRMFGMAAELESLAEELRKKLGLEEEIKQG